LKGSKINQFEERKGKTLEFHNATRIRAMEGTIFSSMECGKRLSSRCSPKSTLCSYCSRGFHNPTSSLSWVSTILIFSFYYFRSILCFSLMIFVFDFVVRVLKRTKPNTIVLTGLSGSGKTVLFYQVIMLFDLMLNLNSFWFSCWIRKIFPIKQSERDRIQHWHWCKSTLIVIWINGSDWM